MTLKDKFSIQSAALSTVLGYAPQSGGDGDDSAVWKLDSPTTSAPIKLELISARSGEEREWVQAVGGIGLQTVTLYGMRHHPISARQDSETAVGGVGHIRWIDSDS
jgi:hypothetical protein